MLSLRIFAKWRTQLISVIGILVLCGCSSAVELPKNTWISLDYSTIGTQTANPQWVESWFRSKWPPKITKSNNNIKGVIIPIFTDGNCFFITKTPPFSGLNHDEKRQERVLVRISKWAKENGISLYLGFDVLNWQNPLSATKSSVLNKEPTWEEFSRHGRVESDSRYASPFNPNVVRTMATVLQEALRKVPYASGVVLDLHMSRREILGYSLPARAESIKDLSIDPTDIPLDGRASSDVDALAQRWLVWRQQKMSSALESLIASCRSINPRINVVVSGDAGFYEYAQLNSTRSSQNWADWMVKDSSVTALIEGRWIPNYYDTVSLANILNMHSELRQRIAPVLMGSSLGQACDYESEWSTFRSQTLSSDTAVLVVRSDEDMAHALHFATAHTVEIKPLHLSVGQIAPPLILPDASGRLWSSLDFVGEKSVIINFGQRIKQVRSTTNVQEQSERITILPSNPRLRTDEQKTLVLYDQGQRTSQQFAEVSEIRINKAGFITAIKLHDLLSSEIPEEIQPINVGSQAPNFCIQDMNGNEVRLADLKGKIVLLSFFPRSFTPGCSSQMASLEAAKDQMQQLGVQTIGISVDPFDLQKDFANHLKLSFPLVPDVGRNLCILYGAAKDRRGLASRLTVLIDQTGKISWIDRQVNASTHGEDVVKKITSLELKNLNPKLRAN